MTREEMLKAVDDAYYFTSPTGGTVTLHDTIFALRRLMEVVHALIPQPLDGDDMGVWVSDGHG